MTRILLRAAVLVSATAATGAVYLASRHASATSTTSATHAAPPPATLPAGAPTEAASTVEMLTTMAALTGSVPDPAALATWATRIEGGEPVDAFIDELLRNERFSREIVPSLLFGSFVNVRNYYGLPSGFVLKRMDMPSGAIFYLREPCDPADAVAVHPWWDVENEVKACPDSYRPTKWTMDPSEHSYRSRMPLTCDSQVGSPELETRSLCGCGPNLIRCMRDEDQWQAFNRSMMDEVKLTTAYVVENELPIKKLFTGNWTFRDRNMELYYLRQRVGALQIADSRGEINKLGNWSTPNDTGVPWAPQWAARAELAPGQHAGLLTAPQILHWLPDRRQRQRGYYEILWCTMRNSFGATTKQVLDLNSTANIAFVHDSWKRLAQTELCTNCHARLDYGFQFMLGYPDSRASTHFDPAQQSTGTGPLYGRDIDDERGSGPLTPAGFAELATDQPEFRSCMATHVVDYVLGSDATPEDHDTIETEITSTGNFKHAFKLALERYAARWAARKAVVPADVATPPRDNLATFGLVNIGQPLRAKLDEHCVECHDSLPYSVIVDAPDKPVDFRPSLLPRALVVSMTDHVAFGMMPKDAPLPAEQRDELVRTLIATLWSEPDARAEAEHYYLTRMKGLPALQIDNSLFMIDHAASSPAGTGWGALERGIWTDQSTITPGVLATSGLEALRACREAAKRSGVKLDDCLAQSLSLQALSRSPVAAPTR